MSHSKSGLGRIDKFPKVNKHRKLAKVPIAGTYEAMGLKPGLIQGQTDINGIKHVISS